MVGGMNQLEYSQFQLIVRELILFMVDAVLMMFKTLILFVVDLVKMMEPLTSTLR